MQNRRSARTVACLVTLILRRDSKIKCQKRSSGKRWEQGTKREAGDSVFSCFFSQAFVFRSISAVITLFILLIDKRMVSVKLIADKLVLSRMLCTVEHLIGL